MTVHHEPGPVVICNTCYVNEFGHDVEYSSAYDLMAAAKAAGWKRTRVNCGKIGLFVRKTQTMDICPTCQAAGRG